MIRTTFVLFVLVCITSVAMAQNDNDDEKIAVANGWIYDDLDRGLGLAQEMGKPLMVVIRCPP